MNISHFYHTLKTTLRHTAGAAAVLLAAASCSDDLTSTGPTPDGSYQGEMVQFAAGTTENASGKRAGEGLVTTPGKTYYMPDSYRFVCRMYYKAATGEGAKYDVTGGSDVTVWMKVKGDVGNALYWRNNFVALDESNQDLFDVFGNDAEATCLYWQNRKEHAFLAWTDLNKARTIGYTPDKGSGALKFVPADTLYAKRTGRREEQWVNAGYELYTVGTPHPELASWEEVRTYIQTDDNYDAYVRSQMPDGLTEADFTDAKYYYAYGWSCKYTEAKATTENVDDIHRKRGWIQYQMFYDKVPYTGPTPGDDIDIEVKYDSKHKPAFLYNKNTNKYLAEIDYNADDPNNTELWTYFVTDEYGNVKYDESTPRYTFYYKELQEKKEQEVVTNLPANVFDLTDKGKTSMAEQPDICQALTRQAPLGATQSANRVNLYFKHQFSQVQVNLKSSEDLSVVIDKDNIQKVELLGVSEKGYVFTELNEDGEVEPTTYESVDISKYNDAHLTQNQYGTSFSMFDMGQGNPDYEYPVGYLKAYNAITFGQLQAIRITWNEAKDGTGIEHKATYLIADDKLRNLKSGYKYIWNIELRRGTLAIVRTEIVDWIVPSDELEYTTDGTIDGTIE